jgi:heptosyltransferase-1
MNILIIKTSSLGDVVHMLPAITDAAKHIPNINIDWVVEESFQAIPKWHPAVNHVFPVAIRRWRKKIARKETWQEIKTFKQQLQQHQYDVIIDAQGLLKSALITTKAKKWCGGTSIGYNKQSIREPLAARFYEKVANISYQQHAILRNRLLLAYALNIKPDLAQLDYGLSNTQFPPIKHTLASPYIVCLHGTSKVEKEWSESNWSALVKKMTKKGIACFFPWGNDREQARALRIAETNNHAQVLPKCNLETLASILQNAQLVVGMDTGLMHIAAALGKTGIGLYPVTKPELTGVRTGSPDNEMLNFSGQETSNLELIFEAIDKQLIKINPH